MLRIRGLTNSNTSGARRARPYGLNPGGPPLCATTTVVLKTPTLDSEPSSFESDQHNSAAAEDPPHYPSHRDASQQTRYITAIRLARSPRRLSDGLNL